MDIILAIGAFSSFVFAFLIYKKANKELPDKILLCWMILLAVNLLVAVITLKAGYPWKSILAFLTASIYVANFPFLYIYTNSLTDVDFKMNGRRFLNFSPVVLMIAISLPLLQLNLAQQKQIANTVDKIPWYFVFAELIFTATFIYFVFNTIKLLQKHRQVIKNTFSYEERVNLVWLRHVVFAFISLLLLTLVVFVLSNIHLFSVKVTDEILYLGLAVIVFYIGYWGLKQRKIFYSAKPQLVEAEGLSVSAEDKAEKSGTEQTAIKSETDTVLEPLLHLMKNEKPYLDPELSIVTLSAKLNMHPHKLSKLINSQLQQNFFDFINKYRVDEFKNLALDAEHKQYSILAIAYDAGFNSKASFNRIFKNITGHTPSQYIKGKNLHSDSKLP